MTPQKEEDQVKFKRRGGKRISLLERAALNRQVRKRQERKLEPEDHAKSKVEHKIWGALGWSNLEPRRNSDPDDQQENSESSENAVESLSASSESEVWWTRLWEGYNERGLLLEWSIQLVERAADLKFPDTLALASEVYKFAHLQLSDWHEMLLDQVYQVNANDQLRAEFTQSFQDHDSTAPISLDSNQSKTQPSTEDSQGRSFLQNPVNKPGFSAQPRLHLSQQEPYAQATQQLRTEPDHFVPQFSRKRLYSNDQQHALFQEMLYYREKEHYFHDKAIALLRVQSMNDMCRNIFLACLLFSIFVGMMLRYW